MPAYHSSFNDEKQYAPTLCGTCVLPVRTKVRGPAPPLAEGEDIIDEALKFFRANVLFKNFESKGAGDLTLAYLTIYIGELIRFCNRYKSKTEGKKAITQLSHSQNFSIPGESRFCLAGFFKPPESRKDGDTFRSFYRQLREETADRLIERLYNEDGSPNKWWMMFSKKKFMGVKDTL
jgi:actin related protein 2/3 complex subunit 3